MSNAAPSASQATTSLSGGRAPSTARGGTPVPEHVLRAIYGDKIPPSASASSSSSAATTTKSKSEQYDESLKTWWKEYADRKNDEEDEHVSDSLLYDYTHLPRMAPAPNLRDDRVRHVPTERHQ